MYEEYFGFREPPFRITPDPRFLYRNGSVEEAAAALSYGIERRKGFLSLVGEAGTGKTTLLRHVLDTLSGGVRTVLLLHPTVEFDEILEYIMTELGIPVDGGRKLVLLQRLHEFLLEHTRSGGNVALIVDEAQDLALPVMEELRLLSNLETGTEKILQIVLAGQPELEAKLADPSLRQLRQRIALHVRLRPFAPVEVTAYVARRLELAGATRADIFVPAALERIAEVSQGIPRVINVLCDACLVTAFATGSPEVTQAIVEEVWADYARLTGEPDLPLPGPPKPTTAAPVAAAPPPPAAPVAPSPAAVASPPLAAPTAPASAIEPVAPAPAPAPQAAEAPPSPPPVSHAPRPVRHVTLPPLPEAAPRAWPVGPKGITAGLAVAIIAILGFYAVRIRMTAPPLPAPVATAPAVTPPTAPVARAGALTPTAPEARAVVHQFLLAYEALDLARLMTLYAPDAIENGHVGRDAIRREYERTFAHLSEASYEAPSVKISEYYDRIALSAPVVVRFREKTGGTGEMHGTAEWEVALRDGELRIVALRYDFAAGTS